MNAKYQTQQAVLEALKDGRAHTADELIQRIWGDDPEGGPDDAGEALRAALRRLRRQNVPVERVRLQTYRLADGVAA